MTDRNPDDLYDALRDRLANYGQEPPAPLWASIRAQLPPPVAAPRLRRRGRVAWLGVLLLLISIGSWQGWRLSYHNGQEVAGRNNSAAKETPISINNQPSTTQPATATPGNATTARIGTTSHTTSATTDLAKTAISGPAPAIANEKSGKMAADARIVATPPRSQSIGENTPKPTPESALATGTSASSAGGAARTTGPARQAGLAGATAPTVATGRPNPAMTGADARKKQLYSTTSGRAKKRRDVGFPGAVATADQLAAAALTHDASAEELHDKNSSSADAARAARSISTGRICAYRALPTTPQLDADAPAAPISFAAWSQLQSRSVALLRGSWATLTVPAPTGILPQPARAGASRWAVQLLVGPALTYRRLGSSGSSAAQAAPVNFYNQAGDRTSVAAQERPAAGFGAQVQVQRVLSGRWTLSTGLGYQEYATRLALQTVPATASAVSPAGTIRIIDSAQVRTTNLRDTYRFVTVPVRVGYWLGRGGRHFRFGLLGGADAAFYLGGATSEASACGCTSQSWGPTGSPYRPLSLSLSLGADLRYRLGPRWELLAQPTGTYFLTPLARPASGFAPRYLLGGNTLLGISYGLR